MFRTHHADARPLTTTRGGREELEGVRIDNQHAELGRGTVHLDPVQTEYIHARLSQIDFAFNHHLQTEALVTRQTPCGAEALPVTRIEADEVSLQALLIQNGSGKVYLGPEEMRHVRQQLERIMLEYLHGAVWGGEDARAQ